MNQYEMMLLTVADLDDEARGGILERASEIVAKNGGSWEKVDDWGRRRLAYEIDKKTEAHYTLVFFDGDGTTVEQLTRTLRITDGVMRVMATTRVPEAPEGANLEPAEEPESDRRGGRGGRGGGAGGGGRGRERSRG